MKRRSHNKIVGRSLRMERCEERCVLSASSLGIAEFETARFSLPNDANLTVTWLIADSAPSPGAGGLGLTSIDSTSSVVPAGAYAPSTGVVVLSGAPAPTFGEPVPSLQGRETIVGDRLVAFGSGFEDAVAPGVDFDLRIGALGLLSDSFFFLNDIKPQNAVQVGVDSDDVNLIDPWRVVSSQGFTSASDQVFDDFDLSLDGGLGLVAPLEDTATDDSAPVPPTPQQPTEPVVETTPSGSDGSLTAPPVFLGPVFTFGDSTPDASGPVVVDPGPSTSPQSSPSFDYGPYQLTADELAAEVVLANENNAVARADSGSSAEDLTAEVEPTNDTTTEDPTTRPNDATAQLVEQTADRATTAQVIELAAGEGAIDLAALLVEATPRVIVARSDAGSAGVERVAVVDTTARDAALAMESWTRSVRPFNPLQTVSMKPSATAAIENGPLQSGASIEVVERTGEDAANVTATRRDPGSNQSADSRGAFWTYAIGTLLGGAVVWMSRREEVEELQPTEERPRRGTSFQR